MSLEQRYAYCTTAELLALQDGRQDTESRVLLERELGRRDLAPERLHDRRAEPMGKQTGFGWWDWCGWVGLTLGTFLSMAQVQHLGRAWIIGVILLNVPICIGVIRYNKWAFVLQTVLSLNPILWIANGIYIKNRWNHPKVNKAKRQ